VFPWDDGEVGLNLLFKKLKTTGRLMMLDAHPDDEDGPTLTYEVRGKGQQVLLMSLTRGEGGQNRTGSNLWDELGVLRTLELLESTRYYGVELRFSRVADFGFSKSPDETFKKWGGKEVPMRDVVYVIREWKPDVLISRFSGTPRDGHGHHQAAGILAPEAVKCAADPQCFPDQLKGPNALSAWQVLKLYVGNQGPDADNTVRIDASQIDPDTKLSYWQMAMEGLRHQASQLSGNFTPSSNASWRSYKLVFSAIPDHQPKPGLKEQDFFDGIDTSLSALPARDRNLEKVRDQLNSIEKTIASAEEKRDSMQMAEASASLLAAVKTAFPSIRPMPTSPGLARLFTKLAQANNATNLLAGIHMESSASTDSVAPGSQEPANLTFRNTGARAIDVAETYVSVPVAQLRAVTPSDNRVAPRSTASFPTALKTVPGMPLTRQHWFRNDPETDTVYQFTDPALTTQPLPPTPFTGVAKYKLNGQELSVSSRVTTGSSKKFPVAVLPPVCVALGSVSRVISTAAQAFEVVVKVHAVKPTGSAVVRLSVPSSWQISPAEQTLNLQKAGQELEARFNVKTPKLQPGRYEIKAEVESAGQKFAAGFTRVTRDDLDSFYYSQPAVQRVSIVDVNVPKSLRVGYIPGAGDDIFPVLQQLGLNAKLISNDELASGDLHKYDTIVVGIRGYDERPEIRSNNQRLLDFVKDGGTLIVQNNKDESLFNSSHFTPYPATLGRDRVTVEEAPVQVLAPNDPVFNSPNKITQGDFDKWVQERGINFFSKWDDHFEPLLASSDPGEEPLKGGLLRAKYGKGTYIYTGYAFFRQLPAGVPGAVRLYINLLNAGHDK
jgi:LmbE family N-acetylglucosaminyl deacetylase